MKRTHSDVSTSVTDGEGQPKSITGTQDDPILREMLRDFLTQLDQKLTQNESRSNAPGKHFSWLKCKPGLTYHPRSWIHSLKASTTDIGLMNTKDASVPSRIIEYLSHLDPQKLNKTLEWHMSTDDGLNAEDLHYLSVFDFDHEIVFRPRTISFQELAARQSNTNRPLTNSRSRRTHSGQSDFGLDPATVIVAGEGMNTRPRAISFQESQALRSPTGGPLNNGRPRRPQSVQSGSQGTFIYGYNGGAELAPVDTSQTSLVRLHTSVRLPLVIQFASQLTAQLVDHGTRYRIL